MNSILSPKASDLRYRVDVAADRQSSFHEDHSRTEKLLLKCAIALHGSGANWKGETLALTRTTLTMVIHGCPLVVASQSMTLCFDSPQLPFDIRGCIQKVTPIGEHSKGRWSRVELEVVFDALDDLKWQRIKILGQDTLSSATPPALRGTLIPLDSGDSLWNMKTIQLLDSENRREFSTLNIERVIEPIRHGSQLDMTGRNTQQDNLVVSTEVTIRSRDGRMIHAYYDASYSATSSESPVMVLSPGYGETKREYIMLAYYFALNGFHVVRYDHTNHVGSSDGDHLHTTLSIMQEDLVAVLNYATSRWPMSSKGLVATSLSGRVAIKTVAREVAVDLLCLLTPIVDVRSTLQSVHQEDLINAYYQQEQKGVTNVLGFNVELDDWLADAVTNQYSDLETTSHDIQKVQSPVMIVSAEHDAWVDLGSTNAIVEELDDQLRQWTVIPRGLHRVLENPKRAKAVYRELVHCARKELLSEQHRSHVQEPTRKVIGYQNRIEREQKKTVQQPMELSGFWKDYLDHFHYIVNFSDYQQLLDHMFQLLGPIQSGDRILDAGCGNGNFGSLMLHKGQDRVRSPRMNRECDFQYVGIDFVPTALTHARDQYHTTYMTHAASSVHNLDKGGAAFHCVDLNKPLPFKSGTFDKIVSNLVLGYLDSPSSTIQELMRVLTPGGILVLSNLKPNSDLSRIFMNFVGETSNTEEVEEAKQLLNNSGKIREAESEGVFQFPDAEELEELFRTASPRSKLNIYSTFANQAYIVAAQKGIAHTSHSSIPSIETLRAA